MTPSFVAVDSSSGPSAGDVYVGDTGSSLIQKFDPSGNLLVGWGGTPGGGQLNSFGGELGGIAVDTGGFLYAYNTSDPSTIHHVAIWLGNNQIIEAPNSGSYVKISTMYWNGFIGAARPGG